MYDYLEINELYHYGIKGQKWGVRRFLNEDGTLTPEGQKRYGSVENMRRVLQKDLNRNDKVIAKNTRTYKNVDFKYDTLKNKLASANPNSNKAQRIENKLNKIKNDRAELKSAIENGKQNTKNVLDIISNSDLNVKSKTVNRNTATAGQKFISMYFLGILPGAILAKASSHEKGTKYKIKK